jgi:hypothetical protein
MKAGAGQREQLMAPAIREFWKAVQQYHTRLAGGLKASLEDMQDCTIVGVHASGTHASRQRTLSILNAAVFTGASVAPLYVITGRQDSVPGKKAQRLEEKPSRNVAMSHVHWFHLLRAITDRVLLRIVAHQLAERPPRPSRTLEREGSVQLQSAQPADEVRAIQQESSARWWCHRVRKHLRESATF